MNEILLKVLSCLAPTKIQYRNYSLEETMATTRLDKPRPTSIRNNSLVSCTVCTRTKIYTKRLLPNFSNSASYPLLCSKISRFYTPPEKKL
jgi:hypothetical protein